MNELDWTNGLWYAGTIGHFVSLLVDEGDQAVAFRVVQDGEPDEDGAFIRHMEIVTLPEGSVLEFARGCHGIHKTLKALLDAGVVT